MLMLALLCGFTMIGLFHIVEMRYIYDRAATALINISALTTGDDPDTSHPLPEISHIHTDDYKDRDILFPVEIAILEDYLNNSQTIPFKNVRRIRTDGHDVFYLSIETVGANGLDGGALLLYTDVTFSTDLVRTVTVILLVSLLIFALPLWLVARRSIRLLDEKDQSIKNFFTNAAHELKTPLMSIRGYADGMEMGIAAQKEACQIIEKETDRMAGLINTILEFSKLDGGMVKPHIQLNDVREILYDAIRVIAPVAEQQGIEVSFEFPDPILFHCDEDMMFSALSNILTNSVRYAESCISITAERQSAPRDRLTICIRNDGQPISNEDAPHIFERFYKGVGGQTGIGMALSQEYVRLQGGEILLLNMDGATVFEITM
ncbi:MAG: HAMP domain-containing histidine kinase [Oscillospiraceae bacterium]|nr:HAMP domain-containing histidine kinase [Oscillospiraceae bacterium]